MSDNQDLDKLLARTNLQTSFEDFLGEVEKIYGITIFSFEPILEGYENANIKITTDKGTYVIKIFAKEVTEQEANDSIKVIGKALHIGVPLPALLEGKDGYLQKLQQNGLSVWYYLMHFFQGENFEQQPVTLKDITTVSGYLAQFDRLNSPINEVYDSWGNKNLITEYEKHKGKITEDILEMIVPVIEEMRVLDTTNFSQSIIHGDLQRKHVLKSEKGEYCILDLGCTRNDALVYDISVLLAWFCLSPETWNIRDEIVKKVLEIYTKIHPLTKAEVVSLPILVKAAYAAYLLKTSILVQDGDTSAETLGWHQKAKGMLERCYTWKWIE